jgi:hypothetical protein
MVRLSVPPAQHSRLNLPGAARTGSGRLEWAMLARHAATGSALLVAPPGRTEAFDNSMITLM